MKRLYVIAILLYAALTANAQVIEDGTKWWDGKNTYIATVVNEEEVFFKATNSDELTDQFTLHRIKNYAGGYTLVPAYKSEEAPLRAQFGWIVRYIREDGMYFLSVRDNQDEIVWTLVLTPDYHHHNCGQLEYALTQPVEDMVSGYLMSTGYLSHFSKDELKYMLSLLEESGDNSIISRTNKSLIKSELKVTDAERESFSGKSFTADVAHAKVQYFSTKAEGLQYLAEAGCYTPSLYGKWEDWDLTFVIMPNSENYTLEIWNAGLDMDYNITPQGFAPLMQGEPGKPICFSYMVSEGVPSLIIACKEDSNVISTWVPTFSGEDGSLVTSEYFVLDK